MIRRNKITAKRLRRQSTEFHLNLTSMIDMFTNIMCFMLINFSVAQFPITPPKDIELPVSTIKTDPEMTLVMVATKRELILEGKKVLDIMDNRINRTDLNGQIIVPLLEKLQEYRKIGKYKSSASKEYEIPKNIILQADKALP